MILETLWLVLGVALLLLVFIDALWTTLWVDGSAGPLTSRTTTWAWHGVMAVVGRKHHHRLSLFGPAVLVGSVLTWGLLLWAGWVFIFSSHPASLLSTSDTPAPADWAGRIWFVAFSISTMGNGDYNPNGDGWQIAASLATLSGFFVASMAISYLLSILAAVVAKRAFASQVSGMGTTGEEFLRNSWDGESFRTLDLPLNSLASMIGPLTEQYLSYPILQYYHAGRAEKSPAVALAILDDALTLLQFGIPKAYRPNPAVLHGARAGVASYLGTLKGAFIDPADEAPPAPDLEKLRQAGIPTVSDEEFSKALDDLTDRRRKLLGLLRNGGWDWSDRQS